MIPIAKNIIVIDEQGNEYEATYPKRAKGLVKNGRARFVDEHTICLACPPNIILEDNNMSDNIMNEKTEAVSNPAIPTLDYILSRIDQIINDNMHVHDAIDAIKNLSSSQGPNYAGDSPGEAIANTVQAREMTNQRLIGLLEKMYDDIRPAKKSDDIVKFQQLTDALCRYPQDVAVSTIQKAAQQMFVHAGAAIVK